MRQKRRNLVFIVTAASAAVVIFGVVFARLYWPSSSTADADKAPSTSAAGLAVSTTAFAQPKSYPCPIAGDFTPVDIPVALLCDYYEHGIEHAPPHDPSGVMQRREKFYSAPRMPIDSLLLHLSNAPEDRDAGVAINAYFNHLSRGEPQAGELGELEELLSRSTLKSDILIEGARAIQWLDSDATAVVFFHTGFVKAKTEYANIKGGDPNALPALRAFCQTKALWRTKSYDVLELRFKLEHQLYPQLSPESRRAGYSTADVQFYAKRYDDAANSIVAVQREHLQAGDLGAMDKGDVYEMNYTLGLMLYQDQRPAEAVQYLKLVKGSSLHDQVAARTLFHAYIDLKRFDDAAKCYSDYVAAFAPSEIVKDRYAQELRDAQSAAVLPRSNSE